MSVNLELGYPRQEDCHESESKLHSETVWKNKEEEEGEEEGEEEVIHVILFDFIYYCALGAQHNLKHSCKHTTAQ